MGVSPLLASGELGDEIRILRGELTLLEPLGEGVPPVLRFHIVEGAVVPGGTPLRLLGWHAYPFCELTFNSADLQDFFAKRDLDPDTGCCYGDSDNTITSWIKKVLTFLAIRFRVI
jgi:hypothetical protein